MRSVRRSDLRRAAYGWPPPRKAQPPRNGRCPGDGRPRRPYEGPDESPCGEGHKGRTGRADLGQVTAETATVVPSLVLLTAMLLWGLLAVAAHIQCVDAARAGARAAARAEPRSSTLAAAREIAPEGARVELSAEGDLVRVRVSANSAGPGPLAVEVSAEAVARAEQPGRRTAPVEGDLHETPVPVARAPADGVPAEGLVPRLVSPWFAASWLVVPWRRRRTPSAERGVSSPADSGSATVWATFCAVSLCAVFAAVLALGQAISVRHRAAGAADLAALAAAQNALSGSPAACAVAERVAAAQGARVVSCDVREGVADVTALVRWGRYAPQIRSRAGPASAVP